MIDTMFTPDDVKIDETGFGIGHAGRCYRPTQLIQLPAHRCIRGGFNEREARWIGSRKLLDLILGQIDGIGHLRTEARTLDYLCMQLDYPEDTDREDQDRDGNFNECEAACTRWPICNIHITLPFFC